MVESPLAAAAPRGSRGDSRRRSLAGGGRAAARADDHVTARLTAHSSVPLSSARLAQSSISLGRRRHDGEHRRVRDGLRLGSAARGAGNAADVGRLPRRPRPRTGARGPHGVHRGLRRDAGGVRLEGARLLRRQPHGLDGRDDVRRHRGRGRAPRVRPPRRLPPHERAVARDRLGPEELVVGGRRLQARGGANRLSR